MINAEWLKRKIAEGDDPEGCPECGAIAGACAKYPNCPGGSTKTDVVAFLVDAQGNGVALEDAQHKLECEHGPVDDCQRASLCTFPRCACPPIDRALPGGLRRSYAEQVEDSLRRAKK